MVVDVTWIVHYPSGIKKRSNYREGDLGRELRERLAPAGSVVACVVVAFWRAVSIVGYIGEIEPKSFCTVTTSQGNSTTVTLSQLIFRAVFLRQ